MKRALDVAVVSAAAMSVGAVPIYHTRFAYDPPTLVVGGRGRATPRRPNFTARPVRTAKQNRRRAKRGRW